ncbi:WD40 repeat domain-containing protein [Lewinella sp. 4G2]|uniref:WD40 repeat domain-containing protein n=1 Tax=Lewinella sp. 4G2 TaxID=1803372 RepID=UPI0012FCA204|nr:hypothetical protein [Lewinella sp. 4G2]
MKTHCLFLLFLFTCSLYAQEPANEYAQCGPILNGTAGAAANFGQTLAISGNGEVLAVGALREGANNGAIHLFRRDGETYRPLGNPITTIVPNALFGRSVALNADGTRLAFGTTQRGQGAGNTQLGFIVYTYDVTETGYGNPRFIIGSPMTRQFGAAVDLSSDGNRIVIGDPDGGEFGRAHVYDLNITGWDEIDQLTATTNSGAFGAAVAISGDGEHLLIGAEAVGSDNDLDDVYQYQLNSTSETYDLVRTYEGQVGSNNFGNAVDIDDDGDTFMIADDDADVGVDLPGYVAVYRYRPDGSTRFFANVVTPPTTSRFGQFGSAAALSGDGNTLVVGDFNYSGPANSAGRVYVYNIPEDGRLTLISSNIIGEAAFTYTGRAVAIADDGLRIAVGSSLANANDGFARVYSPLCSPVATREPLLDLPNLRLVTDGTGLTVDFGQALNGASIEATLVSTDGRVIAQRIHRGGRGFTWPLRLPRGLYVLRLRSKGRFVARKFVW